MPRTFLFYDFETDGAQPSVCRPVQFACLRTDTELNPIPGEDGTVLWCRPAVDRLPAPEACLVTGITPQQAAARGTSEAEFLHEIHGLMTAPDTTSLGWNSLRFDDLVCRFGFWRTFHDPYAHGYARGCTAWDLIDLARAAQALRPDGITWPTREDGAPSFRLEHLTEANGIAHEDAHDALSDVRATVAFGQLLRAHQGDLWAWGESLTDTDLVERKLQGPDPLVHVSARIPAQLGCTSPIRVITRHPLNKRSWICWDLRHDPGPLLEASTEEITRRAFTAEASLPPGESRFALKEIKSNRSPFIAPAGVLNDADTDRLELDESTWRRHDAMLTRDPKALAELQSKLEKVYATTPPAATDVDEAIYDNFVPRGDQRVRDRVHRTRPGKLAELAADFEDPRLPELLFHYRARNHPETLDAHERQEWQERCRNRLLHPPGRDDLAWTEWLSHVKALATDAGCPADHRQILKAVEDWGLDLAASHGLSVESGART
ncbi:MAG: exodeoxyribonuclease I [Phycisphaerales bacterium]|nr:exodeoxyribonuclease I [Phycisphaerales bacterium]